MANKTSAAYQVALAAVVVTLTLSFLIGFIPNYIYGLLPSNSHTSLNMGFVRPTITKMANKTSAAYQVALAAVVVTLILSFLIGFIPNYIYGLLPSNSHTSLNMGFVRRSITKMAHKMATAYQFALVAVVVTLSHF